MRRLLESPSGLFWWTRSKALKMADLLAQWETEEQLGAQPSVRQQPLNPFDEHESDVVAVHVSSVSPQTQLVE